MSTELISVEHGFDGKVVLLTGAFQIHASQVDICYML